MRNNGLKKLVYFALLCAMSQFIWPKYANASELRLDMSVEDLEFEIADNPQTVREWSLAKYATLDKDTAPESWLKALTAYVLATQPSSGLEANFNRIAKKDLAFGVDLAKEKNLWAIYDVLKESLNRLNFVDDFDGYILENIKLLNFNFKSAPIDIALVRLAGIARLLDAQGRNASAKKYANQAKLILGSKTEVSDFRRQSMNAIIASVLMNDKAYKEASEQLFDQATRYFKKNQRHYALVQLSYSYGSAIISQHDQNSEFEALEKAIIYLTQGIQAAETIDSPNLAAASKALLATAFIKLRRYAEAETISLDAIAKIKDAKGFAVSSALISAAAAQIELKKYAEAKDNLLKAEAAAADSLDIPLTLQVELKKLLAQVSFASKNFDKAFRYQIEYYNLDQMLSKNPKFSARKKNMANLGLSPEEEPRARTVESDKFQQYTILAGIAFCLSTGLLLTLLYRKSLVIKQLKTKIKTRVLHRSFHPKFVADVMLGRSQLDLSPQKMLCAVLIADLADFSSVSQRLGPDQTARLLRHFFSAMTKIVFEYEGVVDKFIGDGIMVIFGVPKALTPAKQAALALHCARDMMGKLASMNSEWAEICGVNLSMRIGISQGETIVGSFGNDFRSDFTAVGETVKIAAKIQEHADPGQILVSSVVPEFLPSDLEASNSLHVRGLKAAARVFVYPWNAGMQVVEAQVG